MTIASRAITLLSLCGFLAAPSIAQTPVVFHPADQLAAGAGPWSIAIGDVDVNGAPDLVTANIVSNTVSVMISTVPGNFAAPKTFVTGNNPQSVAIGELNGDVYPDLVTPNLDGTLSVLLGTGQGSFAAPTTVLSGIDPQSIALADLSGDSIADLVTLTPWADGVWVLLGTGTGGFGTPTFYAAGISLPPGLIPFSIQIADMNGDSNPDIVTANNFWAGVSVLLGTGTGTFSSGAAYDVGGNPGAAPAIGDVNEDGILDVAVLANGVPEVSVLLGTGTGSLGAPTMFVGAGDYWVAPSLGDMNRDGHSDLVLGGDVAGTVIVMPGTGTGSFGPPSSFSVGGAVDSVAVADVNVDTKLDVVTASFATDADAVTVLLNANADMAGIAWTYLGHGLAGTAGVKPSLIGNGSLAAGSSNTIYLVWSKSGSLAYLVAGLGAEFNPFFGGVMVPAPQFILGPFAVSGPDGELLLPFTWQWTPGLTFYVQAWVKDAAAPKGFSASNALQGAGQ